MSSHQLLSVQSAFAALHPFLSRLGLQPGTEDEVSKRLEELERALEGYKKKGQKTKIGNEGEGGDEGWFDSAGVTLWNAVMHFDRTLQDGASPRSQLSARIRLIAYRMIQMSMQSSNTPTALNRLLIVVSKTVSAQISVGKIDAARELLVEAAEYEDMLDKYFSPGDRDLNLIRPLLEFYLARVRVSAAEDNHDMSLGFLRKALELGHSGAFEADQYRNLANECWMVGNQLIAQVLADHKDPEGLIAHSNEWLSLGRRIVEEGIARFGNVPGFEELQKALLRSLGLPFLLDFALALINTARCCLLPSSQDPEALAKGTSALQELAALSDPQASHEPDTNKCSD
ncbi:hypothetical protein M231_03251 [Tremella mesenterica]|uniref:Uncharacterized protein n=1 Tax=Tremella mesenterica TaxID=5217 RepID=A0A4Q1BNH2_TREME|nr:hypothetical protein M231_03251 [Tremella mesenterica]